MFLKYLDIYNTRVLVILALVRLVKSRRPLWTGYGRSADLAELQQTKGLYHQWNFPLAISTVNQLLNLSYLVTIRYDAYPH